VHQEQTAKHIKPETEPENANTKATQTQFGWLT